MKKSFFHNKHNFIFEVPPPPEQRGGLTAGPDGPVPDSEQVDPGEILLAQAPPSDPRPARRRAAREAQDGLTKVDYELIPGMKERLPEAKTAIDTALRSITHKDSPIKKRLDRYGIKTKSVEYYLAIVIKESGCNPSVVSRSGAKVISKSSQKL